jgi:hypothetical protein
VCTRERDKERERERERPEIDLGELEERAESSDSRALALVFDDVHFEEKLGKDLTKDDLGQEQHYQLQFPLR